MHHIYIYIHTYIHYIYIHTHTLIYINIYYIYGSLNIGLDRQCFLHFPSHNIDPFVPGPQKLDLHGYSVGASQLAVRWWLQMTVAPYLASERWKIGHEGEWTSRNLPITLVTGFGSSLATYSPKLRPALLELLRGMGLAAEMNRSNPGRIEVKLRIRDMPLLLRCFTLQNPRAEGVGRYEITSETAQCLIISSTTPTLLKTPMWPRLKLRYPHPVVDNHYHS